MARQPNEEKNREVKPKLPPHMRACLRILRRQGYGSTVTEVAKYLIVRGIDDLKRANVLKPEEIEAEHQDSD